MEDKTPRPEKIYFARFLHVGLEQARYLGGLLPAS